MADPGGVLDARYSIDSFSISAQTQCSQFESNLGGPAFVAVSSRQASVQLCLEVLGTRTAFTPCILPVTVPPDVLSGVLRSGAQPVLLDIDPATFCADPASLKEALASVPGAIVVLVGVGGAPIPAVALEGLQDVATLGVYDTSPTDNPAYHRCTFNVFDLGPVVGAGAVIQLRYDTQQKELRLLRDGSMGHYAALPEVLSELAARRLVKKYERKNNNDRVKTTLATYLKKGTVWDAANMPSAVYVTVPSATDAILRLKKQGIVAKYGMFPLHKLDSVKSRFQEVPEYPMAEQLGSQILKLSADAGLRAADLQRIAAIIDEGIE